ncbi:MAG: stage III sporulation protein AB [Lachnospiraceae bacterium]|nr:stage III sporulation protein AB [Robinsoniella sp.]MDY3766498.1 stage III sporulation protein AB [Lachnospiraceae bacterium]
MLRWLGMGVILFSCSSIGVTAAQKMKKRIQNLYDLREGMMLLQGEIRYAKATLPEAFEHAGAHAAPSCKAFFEAVGTQMERLETRSAKEVLVRCAKEELSGPGFLREDLERLERLGEQLGYLDQEMQIKGLEFYIRQQQGVCEEAEREYREKARLYRYMGIIGGLFLVIVLA